MLSQKEFPISQIVGVFWELFKKGRSVTLKNSFHGLPVQYKARISMIGQDCLAVVVHPHQVVCIALERRTVVSNKRLPMPVQAKPLSLDVKNGEVVLGRFKTLNQLSERRLVSRIEPLHPMPVTIIQRERRIEARLADLSLAGLGVLIEQNPGPLRLDTGGMVHLVFELPGLGVRLSLEGDVAYVHRKRGAQLYRAGFAIQPGASDQEVLNEYLMHSRQELLRELERLHQSMRKRKPKRVNLD